MKLHPSKRGQVTIEYALLIALIVAAIVVMTPYVSRAWNSIVRGASDALILDNCDPVVSPVPCQNLTQYEPYYREDARQIATMQNLTEAYDGASSTTKLTGSNVVTEQVGSLRKTGIDRAADDAWLK